MKDEIWVNVPVSEQFVFRSPYRLAGAPADGYRIVDDWQNAEQRCIIPFTKDREIDAYSGYYFTLDR